MSDYDLDTKGIDALAKALKNPPTGRVGILGVQTPRVSTDGAPTLSNAALGAIHEFGSTTHPVRSFLRMPITMLLPKALDKAGLFDAAALREMLAKSSATAVVRKMCIVAETVVLGAFDSGGYGIWPPSNMSRKKVHQTLVETTQLRNSITSEVIENG